MNSLKLSLFSALFCLTVSSAYADDTKDMTSQDYRQGKTFVATAQIVGLGPIPGSLTQGLSFGYFINPDLIISVEAVSGQSPLILFDIVSYRSVKYNSVGVHFKKFIGRTFYFKAGADVNRFTEDYVGYPSTNTYGFDSDSVSTSIVIGNQWQISNFTIGCDWVGATLPISSNIKSEYASTTYNKTDLESDKSRYLKNTGLQLVRFYLGASW